MEETHELCHHFDDVRMANAESATGAHPIRGPRLWAEEHYKMGIDRNEGLAFGERQDECSPHNVMHCRNSHHGVVSLEQTDRIPRRTHDVVSSDQCAGLLCLHTVCLSVAC
eukprot:SAG22_NODE_2145_length_2938_cov_1.732300_4_plen_111_part_00